MQSKGSEIQDEIQDSFKKNPGGVFISKSANAWMRDAMKQSIPKMLFSEFWHEGELSILFASTNVGKSILATQIADSISRGAAIDSFKLDAEKQKVVYFDFEMSEKQFQNRYSIEYENGYQFDENFVVTRLNPYEILESEEGYEKKICLSLELEIRRNKAKIAVIDNITFLGNDTEKAKFAIPLMRQLKIMKERNKFSLLVLAHTPKRDSSKPILRNDLSGSNTIMNICDSSFTIGECHKENGIRYLKQIKARNTEIIYDSENVCLCRIEKLDNFLKFFFLRMSSEWDHLKTYTTQEKEELEIKIAAEYRKLNSYRKVAEVFHIHHMRVKRIVDKLKME